MKLAHAIWYCCLNNSFCCLNTTTRISITLFHPHVFSQYLNNVTKNLLPNGPKSILHQERERERERERYLYFAPWPCGPMPPPTD